MASAGLKTDRARAAEAEYSRRAGILPRSSGVARHMRMSTRIIGPAGVGAPGMFMETVTENKYSVARIPATIAVRPVSLLAITKFMPASACCAAAGIAMVDCRVAR